MSTPYLPRRVLARSRLAVTGPVLRSCCRASQRDAPSAKETDGVSAITISAPQEPASSAEFWTAHYAAMARPRFEAQRARGGEPPRIRWL